MELDNRPHIRTNSSSTNGGGELLICFASHLSSSSSSMKISKSILSPGRARDPTPSVSLSTSLSRRLRSSGSIKGGQASPFFPATNGGKKRGCAFENPEPSSPKVTCIGQVRVKTKKKAKQTRSLSRRRSGEVSFRKVEQTAGHEVLNNSEENTNVLGRNSSSRAQSTHFQQPECSAHRNQRWVHLPVTICEALRAFGAEFSCLFPCKSSCFSTNQDREKEDQKVNNNVAREEEEGQRSCGAVFARWFVALQDDDCEGKQGREIELVVGGEDERTEAIKERSSMRSSRRHVFEDIEVKGEGEEEEKGRVSICIPPKNALLLMRCRSDPMKMASLTNRFWDSPAPKNEDEDEEGIEEEDLEGNEEVKEGILEFSKVTNEPNVEEAERRVSTEVKGELENGENEEAEEMEMLKRDLVTEVESEANSASCEAFQEDQEEVAENREEIPIQETETDKETPESIATVTPLVEELEEEEKAVAIDLREQPAMENNDEEKETTTHQISEPENHQKEENDPEEAAIDSQNFSQNQEKPILETSKSSNVLPDCLLLMMCEPKLSMEVSKETWVCSTDFIRWLPERQTKKLKAPPPDEPKKRVSTETNPGHPPQENETRKEKIPRQQQKQILQPPRSSCSIPASAAAASMATMIEQKLVNAVGYEPFVLTRCKSEPMKTAAAKLAPDSCFWNNRNLEPHRPATYKVGAAGVGF